MIQWISIDFSLGRLQWADVTDVDPVTVYRPSISNLKMQLLPSKSAHSTLLPVQIWLISDDSVNFYRFFFRSTPVTRKRRPAKWVAKRSPKRWGGTPSAHWVPWPIHHGPAAFLVRRKGLRWQIRSSSAGLFFFSPFFAGTSRMARSTSHASHVALHLSMRRHALTALCFFCFVSLDRPCLSVSGCCPHLNPSKFEFDEIWNTKNLNIIYIISPSKIQIWNVFLKSQCPTMTEKKIVDIPL